MSGELDELLERERSLYLQLNFSTLRIELEPGEDPDDSNTKTPDTKKNDSAEAPVKQDTEDTCVC